MQNKKNEKPLGETWQGLYNPFTPRAIEKDNDIVTPLLPVEDVEKPEVVEENPDPELLERMRLSSELREMSTGSGLSQIRADLRERGVNPLSTSSVQGEVQKANRMRSALNGIGIYADDEGYYDVSAIPQQYLSHYNDMETTGSVDVVRDAEGNIQRVRFGNSDIIPYIDNSITNTTFPTQLSRKAQSDYFRELTTNVISQLPTDENGNITYMGVPYQWSELYSALYPIVAQTAHDESLASNPNYFRWHFQEAMGQSYDDWYKEWAAGRIDEIESRIKTLRDEVGAEGRAEGETIGNTEMRGRTSLLPASVRAWMMGALTEDVATKPFDDALEAIKTYRENSFDAGFDEALDLLDVVSFGMMELSTATEQTSILEKARRGEELTKSEQAMLELMQIQQEFEGIKSQLGWEQHWLSKTGSGIGSTVSAAIPFGVGMITTGGVGSMTSLGAGVARNMGVKAAVKQVGKNIVKNTATAYARGAIVAPVMPSTWSAYAQDYKSQYSFNPDGSVAFKPKDKSLMYLGAYIDGMNEFAWEAGGAMLGEIIGHGARFFGRAMRLNNVVDNVLGRVDNTVYGPAVRKAMTWQKSPELREVQRLAGFQGGYLAEASSEVAGDFMSQVMRATVGAETDFEQFKDKDYWITQGLVSVLYGGALNTPHYISNVGEFAKIVGLGKQSQRLIDGVENAELRNRLLSITADGNIDRASSELATIDWSKYHATDKARALDYVRTNYTLQTLSSSVTEDTRTRSYLRDVSAMSDNIYHGGTVEENGTIMRGVANDGRSYYVVDGKPNDKSEASMLTCVDAETGVRKAILASNFEVQTIAGYQETVEQMYNERFSASIEAERLASLQSAYEQMDNPTAEDVASIMEQYHIEAPQIGDNVTLADGRTAEVLNNHGDGTYLMQMNEGTSAIVTVPFYSIQSKDALTASAQRFMIEGRAERATEKAVDIAEGAVAEDTVSEEQGMSPIQNIDAENIPTEESLAEAVQTEQAVEEQGANVVLDMESVPRTEDGSVDYDSIDSPKMFARVYETEAGSREQAMADVVEMRDATAAELEASEGKSKGLINPMKKIAARKEREALRQRIALYDGVIRELEGMDAEYSSIYRNQYSEQIAEPTKAVLNDMAKALGLKVRFVESVDEGRANAKIEDGVVEIAFLNRGSSIAFLMGHEFTHQMQDLGGEAYAKFQNMIRGFVGQETWDAKKNALRAAYEIHGKTITDEALDDELTADVAGELVEKKDVFIDYLRKSKTDTGILSKLSNWLKKMAGLFRNKGAKEYADSVNDLAMQLNNLIAEATDKAAERKEIEETAKANGTWLKAPNGKDTNLTPKQWVIVRTKAFKNWFGDWENDPRNASKIVDENGEPKGVYHGDRKKARYIFSTDTFFTPKAEYAKRYTNGTGEVYATFLDIKKPFDIRDKKAYDIFTEFRGGRKPVATTTGAMDWGEYSYEDLQEYVEDVAANEYDGFILDEGADPDGNGGVVHRGLSFVPFAPNQIKSATENVGTFNANNPDIRYSIKVVRGIEDAMDLYNETSDIDALINDIKAVSTENGTIPYLNSLVMDYEEDGDVEWVVDRLNNLLADNSRNYAPYTAGDVRYSIRTSSTFYSNAEYAVRGIKQEKATPEQWLKMIEKAGGLKAGEDKWLGLSDWLKTSDKKTLTKDEVLQYIAENDIQIEEVSYGDVADISREEIYESAEFAMLRDDLTEYDEDDNPYINRERYDELRSESYDFVDGFSLDYWGEELEINSPAAAATYLGLTKADKEINETRLNYTTQGLSNKREIALTVPTIEPWNTSDNIHFGDAGEGRAVAWIRFGDAETPIQVPMSRRVEGFDAPFKTIGGQDFYAPENGQGKFSMDYVVYGRLKDGDSAYIVYINRKPISKHNTLEEARDAMNEYYKANPRMITRYDKVLVIDEIQSKRHQEGREKGYSNRSVSQQELYEAQEAAFSKVIDYESALADKYGEDEWAVLATTEEMAEYERLRALDEAATNAYENYDKGVPSAPFEKNWAELAFKRMLRYAAENGYDYVAWTTGDQQAERYDMSNYFNSIKRFDIESMSGRRFELIGSTSIGVNVDEEGKIISSSMSELEGKPLDDVVGKEMAVKMMQMENNTSLEDADLKIGGSGMKAFYDQMLPSFVKKYTKKWGAEVKDITMPELEENNTMHAVNVTDSMRDSVMQGQPKFSLRKYNGNVLQKRTDLEAIMRVYNIVSDIVIAKSEIDYKKALSSFGVEEESFEDSYGVYLDWVRKIILNEEIINTPVRLVSTVIHENTHRLTHHLYKNIAKDIAGKLPIKVVKDFAISELKYTEDKFRKKIGYAGFEVVDEIISIFAERLSLMQMTTGGYVLRKYLEGKLSDDEVMRAAEITINEKYDGKYEVLINASYPLLKEILTTYKNEYGKREKVGGVVTWDNDRTSNGGGGKRGDERGDKSQQKSRYEGENESQTRAGAHRGVEGEVDSRLSIRTDTAIAEEEYKQNLLESAQQMEREGHDAQAIADRTGWVHLANGNWKYYGEGKLAITNESSAQRAAYLWLESKKAIKKAQVAKTYDPIIREQKKAIAEIEKNQKDEYKKQRRNVDKVEYILQGQPVESLPIEDQVLVDIALGQRIKWSDGDGKHGLKSELGLQSAKSEGMGAVTLAAKDYVEDYVERLMERNNGYEKSLDDNDIRNAVLEVFRGYPSPKAAIDELYARYKPQADLTQAEDALAKLEYERDSALAAIDAEYREIFDDFDANPDRYVREHQESESYNANLDMYVGSLGKARADVARLERETTKRKLSDEEKASAMRAVKAAIAKELRDGLGRYTRKYDIQRMMDAVNDARTPYAMLKAIDKAMESLFEIKWRREYARMENLTKMKLTYGVTTTDPTTFLNTLVADHKVTASDARKIMNDYWRGVNASGVAVAKYIDDNTRQVFKFVQKYVDFKDAQVALNKEGAFARNLARELRSQIESNSIANDEIRAMLAVPEVRVMAYEATDILERYWTAQSEQLGVANDKDKREISALGIKVKEITSRIADINAQIKETTNKKVVVYKGEAIDADLARKRLTEEYNSLIAERMEAYEKMYSVMPNIIKSMQDANNALENLLRTGRVQLAKERAERMEAERQLVNDAIRDMGAENAVNILDRSIQDTRDIRRGAWYQVKGLAGDTLGAALGSIEYMLRKMGVNAPMGEGRMFDHFAPALQRAYDNIFTSTRECKQILDDKSMELWGKTYPEIHKLAENTKIGATYDNRDIYVTQALYFLAMWDQAEARKAMEEKQGFSAEKIDAIRNALNNLDPRWLEFSDWIIHDFMPSRRDRYNEVHKKLFGTSMAHVSNYFPIKRAKEAIHNDVDVSTPDTNLLPSTVVGAIKERTSNIVPIDVETSFFEALNDNVATMESWVEMSPIIEDFNALLSSTTVREMMADISPSMHNDFKEAAKVATLEYVGKIPDIDKNWGTILNRLWAGTKIAFRLFTAFKQLSSALLFAGYSGSPEFQARLLWRYISGVGHIPLKVMQGVINGTSTLTGDSFKKIDIMGNIDWAKSTLPSFARRWEEGFAGNEVMKRTLGNKSWKNRTWVTAMDEVVTEVSRIGFKPNAFIDAFTVAAGARAVYDFEVNRLQKEGYSAEKAHTIAVMKAEMMYNSTQQSSEGMYLAPMQKDRSILATTLSTFMNAPFAMSRNMVVGFNELMRNAKAERKDVERRIYTRMMKAYRESIENTIISEIDSGKLGDEDAIKARRDELTAAAIIEAQSAAIPMAKAKVKDAKIKAALAIVLNGYGGQLYFNLMSQLPALIFGDDDEEKKQILQDLALHSLWEAPLSMIPVINILPAAINGYSANIFPAVNELTESVVEIVDSIKEGGVDMEVVKLTAELGMRWGLGLEIDTWKNMYIGLESMIEDSVSPEAILKVMNAPEKQIRNIVGQRREDESEKEYVERVMRFYSIFNDPKLDDYFDTDMYVRNAYGAPTKYRSLASRYNGDTPFGMTKSQMQRIKYEEAYRRNVVLRYGGSAALHDYENTEAQYKDLRNEGVDDFKYGQQQVLQRMSSLVNAKAAALSRRVGKDDPRYYELLLDLQELQQKYIDKYEQFKQ